MPEPSVGRLPGGPPPSHGERFADVTRFAAVRIEAIVSSATPESVEHVQDHDEWVLLLEGSATLDVDGTRVELSTDSWAMLPAGTPHRVVRTDAGTRWLAIHADVAPA
jgi:cupin 2 domain-containing protein